MRFAAITEGDQQGYHASCPELNGCQAQGDTVEEALANLRKPAQLYLETLRPEELQPEWPCG